MWLIIYIFVVNSIIKLINENFYICVIKIILKIIFFINIIFLFIKEIKKYCLPYKFDEQCMV